MRGEGRGGEARGVEWSGGSGGSEGSGGEEEGKREEARGAQTSNSSVERYQSTILLLTQLQAVRCRLNTQNVLSYKQHEPH